MTAFYYIGLSRDGKKQKGVIEAENAKHARQLVREQQLTPLEVYATQEKRKLHLFQPKVKISIKELALMTRQLASLLTAGMPIEEVLAAVAEQTEKPSTKAIILSVRSKVLQGHTLAAALSDSPEAFSNLYCATIAAGEKTGHLDIVLQRLADYTEQQFHLRQKIQQALIYPTVMVLVSISIVGFLLEYVVPKMISVYSNMGQALPLVTQILIGLSNGIKSIGIYCLITTVLGIGFFSHRLKNNVLFREKVHALSLRIPLIGAAIKTINTARFSRTFAILSQAGVPILEAMTVASKLMTNLTIRHAVELSVNHVREGAPMHLALKQTRFFPPMSIHLIASGEASGQLESMLERAATNQEGDITRLISTSLALFEPAIILLMGAIVLFIVLAVLLPIFQLDQFTG